MLKLLDKEYSINQINQLCNHDERLVYAWVEFLEDIGWIAKVQYADHEGVREKFSVTEKGRMVLQKHGLL